jgi:hypothetical protein
MSYDNNNDNKSILTTKKIEDRGYDYMSFSKGKDAINARNVVENIVQKNRIKIKSIVHTNSS